ncbi:PREDICTED: uncharacterized protein LOC109192891 [Ipomoea nil]|uniref:uncharacterized protein LOC109192891 n=1 Tax=Ipomoea nil TaxID=35883 RepID=UPI0009012F3A|nr:PREDICTED: uncharacterized protein LOC109192891 [Ipomoea nil]
MDAAYPEVSVELMNLFHEIDRKLYSTLVFELERDPKVSVNIIALWIWLEKNKIKNAVDKVLSSPIKLINGLADEALSCLRCITDDMYLFSSDASEITLTQNVLAKQLSLKFFHENRTSALSGIRMVVETVCVKVLDDLIQMAITRNAERQLLKTQMVMMPPPVAEPKDAMIPRFGGLQVTGESSRSVVPPMDPMTSRFGGFEVTGESSQSVAPPIDPMIEKRFGGLRFAGESSQSVVPPIDPMVQTFGGLRFAGESSQSVVPPIDPLIKRFGGLRFAGESSQSVVPPIDPMIQKRFGGLRFAGESSQSVVPPIGPLIQRFGGLRFAGESSQPVVPPIDPKIQSFGGLTLTGESSGSAMPPLRMEEPKDNRTMYATFSNGYPVSDWELWIYFNRMYGDCVESISMQQVVEPNDQSMFALIVFTSPRIVHLILRGLEKAFFTIQGKEVWIRK